MSAKSDRIIRQLAGAIQSGGKQKTSPYDTTATVRRIENGVAWVHIPGGVDETPVRMTINAAPGDQVQVRVSGGRAFLVGNATAPPTDDKTAVRAVKAIEVTNKVVETVKRVADRASRIAGNTAQYFWHTETGTDTGVHITEIPQKDFLADPEHGGGNLLARSNGIAVRDGLRELSRFSAEGSQIGADDDPHVVVAADGMDMFAETGDYANESGNYFSVKKSASSTVSRQTSSRTVFGGDSFDFRLSSGLKKDGESAYYVPSSTIVYINGTQQSGSSPTEYKGDVLLVMYSIATGDMIRIFFTDPGVYSYENGKFIVEYDPANCVLVVTNNYTAYANGCSCVISYKYEEVSAKYRFGTELISESDSQAVFGKYNDNNANNVFEIGNGTDEDNRSNAMAVSDSGDLTIAGKLIGGLNFINSWAPTTGYSIASSSGWSSALGSKTFTLAAGKYLVLFGADFSADANGYRMVQFQSTSTGAGGNRYTPSAAAVPGGATRLMGAIIVSPTASTTYSVYVAQNSGSSLTVTPWVQIIKVG